MTGFDTLVCIIPASKADADFAPLVAHQVECLFNGIGTVQISEDDLESLPDSVVGCVILGAARVNGHPWVRLTLDKYNPRHHRDYTNTALLNLSKKCEALRTRKRLEHQKQGGKV